MSMRDGRSFLITLSLVFGLGAGQGASAQVMSNPGQEASERAQGAAIDSLASWTAVFQSAAQQWVAANVTNDPWNVTSSMTPNTFGTYAPILLYAGAHSQLCGAPTTVTESVDLISAGYLPTNFEAPFSGEYCAVIYPDSGVATVSGPVGPEGGTDAVPATTVLAYFVVGTSKDTEGLLANWSGQDVVSHLAPILGQNFAAGGVAMRYAPAITNSGTSTSSTWESVAP